MLIEWKQFGQCIQFHFIQKHYLHTSVTTLALLYELTAVKVYV